jgi:hypothetical protein
METGSTTDQRKRHCGRIVPVSIRQSAWAETAAGHLMQITAGNAAGGYFWIEHFGLGGRLIPECR